MIELCNAATVQEGTTPHGLGWFALALLERVGQTYRALGLIKSKLDVRHRFTNDLVRTLQ